jgi:aspartyl-tRNA(Asn)/glutamyl-tRNA(Gln) amidotransferase subunit A
VVSRAARDDGSPGASALDLAAAIRSGRRDPVEVVEAALARIEAVDAEVGAFVAVDAEGARRKALDRWRTMRDGGPLGPLHGVPLGVKDLFDVAGQPTRAGSMVPPDPAAERDAVAVSRLRAAGAVVVGRTRTHEFAWGLTTQHPVLGGTRNPHDLERIPGGSSGGSAAAVAAGMVPVALGTDTGCSLRLPAAFCGVVAHKPSYGLVPTDGVLPLAPSLDHAGALVRTVADARFTLGVLAGVPLAVPAATAGLRVGLVESSAAPRTSAAVGQLLQAAASRLASRVRRIGVISLPLADRLADIYRCEQGREALAWHRATHRWPAHAAGYGADVRARLRAAEQIPAAESAEASRLRAELRVRMDRLFAEVDVVAMPVASCGPSRVTDPDTVQVDGQHGDLRAAVLPWTVLANLGGWPACSVPIGRDDDGLPVGVQIVGPVGADARVLDVAAEVAVATDPS